MNGISHVWMVRTDLLRTLPVVIKADEVDAARHELHALLNAP